MDVSDAGFQYCRIGIIFTDHNIRALRRLFILHPDAFQKLIRRVVIKHMIRIGVNKQHFFPGKMSQAGLLPRIVRLWVHATDGSVYDWYNVDTIRLLRFAELRNKADEGKMLLSEDGSRFRKIYSVRERIDR